MPPLSFEEQIGSRFDRRQAVKSRGSNIGNGWAVLLLAGATVAAEPAPADSATELASGSSAAINPMHTVLTNKLQLLEHQFSRSAAVQRIRGSHHVEARTRIADARALYEKADFEFDAGRFDEALELIDESLRLIVLAAKLMPDGAQMVAQEQSQNAEMREAIRIFWPLHENFVKGRGASSLQTSLFGMDLSRVSALTSQADAFMANGNHHETNLVLRSANQAVVSTLNQMLMAQTIVYDLKFESKADEFVSELAKNKDFEKLIAIAPAQLKVTPETTTMVGSYVQHSRDLRATAQSQASSGDYVSASRGIHDASAYLQRSLRNEGVVVPQSQEITD